MSWPASSTWPPRLAACIISCIRLSMRRKVDLPQPEGPIRAVTDPASIRSDTRSSTLGAPNQADTLRASSPIRELAVMTALLRPPGSSMAVSGMTVSGWSAGPDQAPGGGYSMASLLMCLAPLLPRAAPAGPRLVHIGQQRREALVEVPEHGQEHG